MSTLSLFVGLVFLSAPVEPGSNVSKPKSALKSEWGLHMATFDTLYGQVVVTLPDEMRPGRRISGAFMIDPVGKTDEERQKNADILNGYVARIGGKDCKVSDGNFSMLVPLGVTLLAVALDDTGGKSLASINVPINEGPNLFSSLLSPKPTDFDMPVLTQFGRPIAIRGPFDGNYATTSLKYGGKELPVLGETDGKMIASGNTQHVGKTEMMLMEQNVVVKSEANNVRPILSADKSTLLENETTTCHARVDGLEGLEQENYPIAVEFKILTDNIKYTSEAGRYYNDTIDFNEVKNGTWTMDFQVTGLKTGPFALNMTVAYTLLQDTKDGMTPDEFKDWLSALIEMYNGEIKKINEEEKQAKKKVANCREAGRFEETFFEKRLRTSARRKALRMAGGLHSDWRNVWQTKH